MKMGNFMFSVNATLPIFIVMVVGYLLKRKDMFNGDFVTITNKFNFTVTLPALVFQDLASANIRDDFDMRFVLFCAIVTTICFLSIWGGTKRAIKEKSLRAEFVQASFRGSAAVLGLAFIQNIYGHSEMGSLMIIGAVPLYNIYSVVVLTLEHEGEDGQKEKIKQACLDICKNPVILSILAGVLVSISGIRFPTIVNKTIQYIASMATPLALIVIGAGFEGRKAIAKIKPTLAAAFIKLIFQPLLFLPLAAYLGFRGEKMVAIIIMLASPATPSCYIMAKNMKHEGVLTSSIIVMTTLMASVTLTFWIFILKTYNFI